MLNPDNGKMLISGDFVLNSCVFTERKVVILLELSEFYFDLNGSSPVCLLVSLSSAVMLLDRKAFLHPFLVSLTNKTNKTYCPYRIPGSELGSTDFLQQVNSLKNCKENSQTSQVALL